MEERYIYCFVNFSKAYDSIDRSLLWERLSGMGLSHKMLSANNALYRYDEGCVCVYEWL